jgi:hypothetical protein
MKGYQAIEEEYLLIDNSTGYLNPKSEIKHNANSSIHSVNIDNKLYALTAEPLLGTLVIYQKSNNQPIGFAHQTLHPIKLRTRKRNFSQIDSPIVGEFKKKKRSSKYSKITVTDNTGSVVNVLNTE